MGCEIHRSKFSQNRAYNTVTASTRSARVPPLAFQGSTASSECFLFDDSDGSQLYGGGDGLQLSSTVAAPVPPSPSIPTGASDGNVAYTTPIDHSDIDNPNTLCNAIKTNATDNREEAANDTDIDDLPFPPEPQHRTRPKGGVGSMKHVKEAVKKAYNHMSFDPLGHIPRYDLAACNLVFDNVPPAATTKDGVPIITCEEILKRQPELDFTYCFGPEEFELCSKIIKSKPYEHSTVSTRLPCYRDLFDFGDLYVTTDDLYKVMLVAPVSARLAERKNTVSFPAVSDADCDANYDDDGLLLQEIPEDVEMPDNSEQTDCNNQAVENDGLADNTDAIERQQTQQNSKKNATIADYLMSLTATEEQIQAFRNALALRDQHPDWVFPDFEIGKLVNNSDCFLPDTMAMLVGFEVKYYYIAWATHVCQSLNPPVERDKDEFWTHYMAVWYYKLQHWGVSDRVSSISEAARCCDWFYSFLVQTFTMFK